MKNVICRCVRVVWLSICADYIPWKFSNIKNETNRYSDEINRMYLAGGMDSGMIDSSMT